MKILRGKKRSRKVYWRSEKGERFVKREEIFKLRESGRSIREKKGEF
jgi:hypothetical protein